jgi:hypothetical protein
MPRFRTKISENLELLEAFCGDCARAPMHHGALARLAAHKSDIVIPIQARRASIISRKPRARRASFQDAVARMDALINPQT